MAIKFIRLFDNGRLYAADTGPGQLLLILPQAASAGSIGLSEAWSSTTLLGDFAYTAGGTGVTPQSADTLITAVLDRVAATGAARGFVWLADPTAWQSRPLDGVSAPLLGMDGAGTRVQAGLDAPVVTGVRLTVASQSSLTLISDAVTIGGTVAFAGEHAPAADQPASSAVLSFMEGTLGTITFQTFLRRQSLLDQACWGFQFVHPADPASAEPAPPASEWLPFASGDPAGDALGFSAVIDPSDPANGQARLASRSYRSRLAFSGHNRDGSDTVLASAFRTRQGTEVTLYPVYLPGEANPAALVFNEGPLGSEHGREMQLGPMGEFELAAAGVPSPADLLCGLQGTEVISFRARRPGQPGDRIGFTPYQAAYAPRYPFPDTSPVTAPVDASLPLLDGTYTTSWATVTSPQGAKIPYVAQPKGAALYGQDDPIWRQGTGLMGWQTTADTLPLAVSFPLVPYSALAGQPGAITADGIEKGSRGAGVADFERQVVGPTRRRLIPSYGQGAQGQLGPGQPKAQAGGSAGAYNTVTSAGLLATIQDSRWTRVLLGLTVDPPRAFYFCNLTAALQQAFQTSDVMLVAANADQLGKAFIGKGGCEGNVPLFANTLEIGGWELAANVGTRNRYADYHNVLIIKGRGGKLYDPANPAAGLVSNPERWTEPGVFAAPTDLVPNPAPPPPDKLQPADPAQAVVLSQWLQDYFAAAARTGGDDLARFNAMAADENWTGILVLRMDITRVPDDLAGIMAGIADPGGFNAHHLGIELTPVSAKQGSIPGPTVTGASSIFGLIDYVDPAFKMPEAGQQAQPVPPDPATEYEFRLLSMQVSFANTAVHSFRSYAQLTATNWFGTPVAAMGEGGNPYGAIILHGSLQANDGQPVYAMSSTADAVFYFDHDVLAKLEITGAAMSTRNAGRSENPAGDGTPQVASWFGLTGYLDFRQVRGEVPGDAGAAFGFDVYSFGSDPADGGDQLGRGLAFSNLGIAMTFLPENPQDCVLALDAGEIRFDVATSTPRPGSIFRQFALEVSGLLSGGPDTPPSKGGYATVVTDARLTGVDGSRWWGVDYRLPLGTPGNLAGRVGLTAHLLTAWCADAERDPGAGDDAPASYRAMVGLQLPGSGGGAGLISLQTVLKLSVGQVWLQYDTQRSAFLLLFTELALKLFGLVSVPPGSTLLYLYGDPSASDGSPSGLGWYAMYRKDVS